MKKRGMLPGLCFSNELISGDEGLHCDFACLMYPKLKAPLPQATVYSIVFEAVEIEKGFICDALLCSLIGMNNEMMSQYIEFVADRLCRQLGVKNIYGTKNPFDWMDLISLQGKTNFFEKRDKNPGAAPVHAGGEDAASNLTSSSLPASPHGLGKVAAPSPNPSSSFSSSSSARLSTAVHTSSVNPSSSVNPYSQNVMLNAEFKELVARLEAENKSLLSQLTAANSKLNAAQSTLRAAKKVDLRWDALRSEDPDVIQGKDDMLIKTTIVNNCTLSIKIHEEPDDFFKALSGRSHVGACKGLYQDVLKVVEEDVEYILYWSIMFDVTKCCDIFMRFKVEKREKDEIKIQVTFVDANKEIDEYDLPVHPHPNAAKYYRLLLNKGDISLRYAQFGQTIFSFTAEVGIEHVQRDKVDNLKKRNASRISDAAKTIGVDFVQADKLFILIGHKFYNRFKKEDTIDGRMKEDFIDKLPIAPSLTVAEQGLISKTMVLVSASFTTAKRVPGTVNDPVEKYMWRSEGGDLWGKSVAKIDVAAEVLLAELWVKDTYQKKAKDKHLPFREVFNNLDGTRSLQFTNTVVLPGGFQDRVFDIWHTWDSFVDKNDGRQVYITVSAPMTEYPGTRHKLKFPENTIFGTFRNLNIIKQLTENACEWTRALTADYKFVAIMPQSVLDFISLHEVGRSTEQYEKFRRNGREVDREKRAEVVKTIRSWKGKKLDPDQQEFFKRSTAVWGDGDGDNEGWKPLKATANCPDIEMSMKYFPPKKGERSVATGKAVGVVDCSAEEVAAWALDYCSNDRMRLNREEGHMARLQLENNKGRANESSMATVKVFPFFLNNREFVFRQIWKSEEGRVWIPFDSIPDEVDYGVSLSKIRGLTRGFYLIETLPDREGANQVRTCEDELRGHIYEISTGVVSGTFVKKIAAANSIRLQKFDAGGILPMWIVNREVPAVLDVVQNAIDEFRQDEEVDKADRNEVLTFMKERWNQQNYSADENALLKRVSEKFEGSLKVGGWKHLTSPDSFVKMDSIHDEKGAMAVLIGRAITVIDASIEDCASWEYLRMARERVTLFREGGGLERKVVKLNDHCDLYYLAMNIFVGQKPREFLNKVVWKRENENTIIVGFEDVEVDNFPTVAGKGYVRASSVAFFRYEKLPDFEGIPQTKVTYYEKLDLKGLIPRLVATARAVKTLALLTKMRLKFDRSYDIDARNRATQKQTLEKEAPLSAALKEAVLTKFQKFFNESTGSEQPSKIFGLATSKVNSDLIGGHAWGKTTVRFNTEMEEAAAFFWDFGSRANMEISGDIERSFEVEEGEEGEKGVWRKIVRRRQRLEGAHGGIHRDRLFTSEMTLDRCDEDTVVIIMTPIFECSKGTEKETKGRSMSKARGSVDKGSFWSSDATEKVFLRLKRFDGTKTKVEYACELEIGLGVSARSTVSLVERRLVEIADASIYFQRLVPLEKYEIEDGQALAHDMLWKAESGKKRVERCKEIATRSRGFRELIVVYPWIFAMMTTAMRGMLHRNQVVKTKFDCVSEAEAVQIGKNLIPSLKSKKLAEAGVDQWKVQNKAVKTLMEKYGWFEPMAVTLGKGIVKTASWGLMWRVGLGAVLSFADLATDIFVLKQFWERDDALVFRNLQLTSLATYFVLQLILVVVQNRDTGMSKYLKEFFIVLTGFKGPWDAYRVAIGAEQEKEAQFDPMMELTYAKCIELFAESIPGILIQLSAILSALGKGQGVSLASKISLLISVLTTGFVSATISFEFDTDPKKRAFNPGFYGFVPDSANRRAILLLSMIFTSGIQVFIKSIFVITLGIAVGPMYSWLYLGADMLIFLLYKIARDDFYYWLPINGIKGFAVSLIVRTVLKIISDFTASPHFRHPYEMGGLYFTLSMFLPFIG
ncbi:hypothetical protein TL16_g13121 [Triparma laevis f. inornata]|uniref:Uncharacterized protein n=1 Tax=Triparma laevis f. inornata TaxID=1714386 RepID=A0A9W7BR95_9STRA|nr:hypothetical protein TL16_g13121 [Triparma laevis f. inornata]